MGFVLLVWSLPGAIAVPAAVISRMANPGPGPALADLLWAAAQPGPMMAAARLVMGLYLFFGGRWVARQITRGLGVAGLCPRCGYDVRGLDTGRCPECGARLSSAA